MFKFLSFFRKNKDEQLIDNEYDLNEISSPVVAVKERIEEPISSAIGEQPRNPTQPISTPVIDTKGQDERRINDIKAELNGLTGDPHPPSGDEATSTVPTSSGGTEGGSNTTETQKNTPLVPDLSLILEYEDSEEERPEIIGVTRFQKGDKILDFVTVDHCGNVQDHVHRTLAAAITTGKPKMVVTEGHPTYLGDDESNSILDTRAGIIDETKKKVEKEPGTYIPEAGYAAYLAREHGISSVGGEVKGKELFDGMKARVTKMEPEGYPPEAIIADAFMREIQVIDLKDRLAMTEEEFMRNHGERLLKMVNEGVDPLHTANITPLTPDQFKEWYATHPLSEDRRFFDVDYEDFTPKPDGGYHQVMACESGFVRDANIVKLIAHLLNQDGTESVLVEYGSDHLNSQRPVLDKMFGAPGIFTELVNEADVHVEQLGHYKDKDLAPAVVELVRRDKDCEIQVYGTKHNVLTDRLKRVAEEIGTSHADVYFVEVEPSKLPSVYEYPTADAAFQALGESAYIAWLAHQAGKEVKSWDIPFVEQLEDGYQKLGAEGIEPILGSVLGQGLHQVLSKENGQQGDRAEQIIKAIELGLGPEVLDFFEQKSIPVTTDVVKRIITKYSAYDLDTMTEEDISNFLNPDQINFFTPYGDGPVNNANRACNETRDEHAIREITKAKRNKARRIVLLVGEGHTRILQKPLEFMYPGEEVTKIAA